MGFWGPTVKERNRAGRTEYYGKCDECKTEYSDYDKRSVTRKLENCERDDKKNKRREADAAAKEKRAQDAERADAARTKKQQADARDAERKRKEMWAAKKKGINKINQLKREANGYCAHCNSNPCKGKKPKCARTKAVHMESLMDFDPSDPAQFDPQMKNWFD